MSLSHMSGTSLLASQSQDLLKKFRRALQRVANEHGTNDEAELTEQELIACYDKGMGTTT